MSTLAELKKVWELKKAVLETQKSRLNKISSWLSTNCKKSNGCTDGCYCGGGGDCYLDGAVVAAMNGKDFFVPTASNCGINKVKVASNYPKGPYPLPENNNANLSALMINFWRILAHSLNVTGLGSEIEKENPGLKFYDVKCGELLTIPDRLKRITLLQKEVDDAWSDYEKERTDVGETTKITEAQEWASLGETEKNKKQINTILQVVMIIIAIYLVYKFFF